MDTFSEIDITHGKGIKCDLMNLTKYRIQKNVLNIIGRTSGDGMDQEDLRMKTEAHESIFSAKNEESRNRSVQHQRSQLKRKESQSIQETVHQRKLSTSSTSSQISLPIPGLATLCSRPDLQNDHNKNKSSRFVAFQPHFGTVEYTDSNKDRPIVIKKNKNNLDIGVLVSQMSNMRTQELDETSSSKAHSLNKNEEMHRIEEELRKVKEERDNLKGQLKFHTQVNSELKNLLVASVGEDLQTRVNVLTEDKLQLAKALLDTAKNLSTHTVSFFPKYGTCN